MKERYTLLIIGILTIVSCNNYRKSNYSQNIDIFSNNSVIIREDLEFIQLKDTIELIVLGYVNAVPCSINDTNFSTCYGMDINSHLFYKIKSLCNEDSTLEIGDFIRIAPRNYPLVYRKTDRLLKIEGSRGNVYSPLNAYNFKLTYGDIIK